MLLESHVKTAIPFLIAAEKRDIWINAPYGSKAKHLF